MALARYFPFAAGELELVAALDDAVELVDARFEAARAAIWQVRELAQGRMDEGAGGAVDRLEEGKRLCRAALGICDALLGDYDAIGREMGYDAGQSGSSASCAKCWTRERRRSRPRKTGRQWPTRLGHAAPAASALRPAHGGHRLRAGLPRDRHVLSLPAAGALPGRGRQRSQGDDVRMAVSGRLTGLLNNGVPANDDRVWLSDWLKAKMREIDVMLQRISSRSRRLQSPSMLMSGPITSPVGSSGSIPELSAWVPEEKNPPGIPSICQPAMASTWKSSQLRIRSTRSARSRMRSTFPSIRVASVPAAALLPPRPVQANLSALPIRT